MQETWVLSLGLEDPLEKEMATHSSTLDWKIPWMEEPRRLHTVLEVTKSRTRLSDDTYRSFYLHTHTRWLSVERIPCQCRRCSGCWFKTWVRKVPWKKKWQPTPILLSGESRGQRTLAGYDP